MPVSEAVVSAPAKTAAGGKIKPLALYQVSSMPAAAPWAATGGSTGDSSASAAKESVAEQRVPERKPFG